MQDTTFGSSPAAKTLASMLDKRASKKLSANVTSYWSGYCHGVREIMAMPDKRVAHALLMLWRKGATARAKDRFDTEISNFVINLTTAKYRDSHNQLKDSHVL